MVLRESYTQERIWSGILYIYIIQLGEFIWNLRPCIQNVFNRFLLFHATDRGKISNAINIELNTRSSYTIFNFSRTLPIFSIVSEAKNAQVEKRNRSNKNQQFSKKFGYLMNT